ncbi:MAG: Rid family detoxifying hydrolase [Pseudarcicella sp.]|nr:Rid family detoxifying hydrolase [Pseudarcicella sp.]MBP6410830.1 Rid family detoxifying hydrolase [Pseudarcicella sp.]
MNKKIIFTPNAPAPIGPYSQAVLVENTLYVSGQIAADKALAGVNIQDETTQVLMYLKAIVEASGMTFDDVVKCSIFVKNMGDFGLINQVYADFFVENPPARETVEVSALPKNVNIEISCIAVK